MGGLLLPAYQRVRTGWQHVLLWGDLRQLRTLPCRPKADLPRDDAEIGFCVAIRPESSAQIPHRTAPER